VTEKKLTGREKIMEAASRLFYRDGFHAVGIDTIVAESGIAKMTLYHHFSSKDELIVAYLDQANQRFWNWLEGEIAKYEGKPRAQLESIFKAVGKLASNPTCLGCTFQSAAGEFPDLSQAAHAKALEHKNSMLDRLRSLAKEAGARNPKVLAEQLLLLMDGAWAAARMFGPGSPAAQVSEAAKALIAAQVSAAPKKPGARAKKT
jgi:AcrR family transcriptional regulator